MKKIIFYFSKLALAFSLLFLMSCQKKVDKLITIDDGLWLVRNITEFNEGNNPNEIQTSQSMIHMTFNKDGTGVSGIPGRLTNNFKWEIKNEEIFIENINIPNSSNMPLKLKSKTKDMIVWESTYKYFLEGTIKYTMEMLKL